MVELVLGLLGTIGAGKDTAADYLIKKYKFQQIEMGDLVRDIAKSSGLSPTRLNLQRIQRQYRSKYGSDYFINLTIRKIKGWKRAIINGIRTPTDAEVAKNHFGKKIKIVLIDADPRIRFSRLKKRHRAGFPNTHKEFLEHERREWQLFDFKRTSQFTDYIVPNNGALSELYKRLDALMVELGAVG